MKTKFTLPTVIKVVLIMGLFAGLIGCGKNLPLFGNGNPINAKPAYNLDVLLNGLTINSPSSGFIEFRQDSVTFRMVNLDTKVTHLEPNHSYILERAVNPITDTTGCSSTAWLQLGLGLAPESIHTDAFGNGEATLWRNLTSAAPGAAYHIHFQVIDSASTAVVLTSDCYNYVVK